MRSGLAQAGPFALAALVLGVLFFFSEFREGEEPSAGTADDRGAPRLVLAAQPVPAVPAPGAVLSPTRATAAAQGGAPQPPNLLHEVLDRSRLSASWLQSHGFTPGSAALQRLHGLLQGHVALTATEARKIAFGPQDGDSALPAEGVPTLAQQERYVQAVMQPEGLAGDSVLLRWRNASDNALIELSAQAIPPNASEQIPIWRHTTEDWPPGRYRVEVIAPQGDLALLAAGEFVIAAPHAPVTPFARTAVDQLRP